MARGRELFLNQCSICHGEQGDGQGKFAYLMNPRPRNFKRGKFKLSTTQNLIPTDQDLMRTIQRGMPGSAMPPWDHLLLADLKALVRYIRHIHKTETQRRLQEQVSAGRIAADQVAEFLALETEPGAPLSFPPEPLFDNLRWFNGRRLYLEACAACHGAAGEPVPEAVKFDEDGYPVPPRSFVKGIFKGGNESHQLYARIVKGMAGTPMPAFEGSYSDDDLCDLIKYVQSLSQSRAQERAEMRRNEIVASRIQGVLPGGPDAAAWDQARPVYVALTPLWWSEVRIEGLSVKALHNDDEVAIRLSWIDPTADRRNVRIDEFRDAVAIQFSLTSNPPFYMGNPGEGGGVNMWLWKADRSQDIEGGYQDVDAAFPDRAVDMYPEQRYVTAPDRIGAAWPKGAIEDHHPPYITAWGVGNLVASPELKTPVESLTAHGPGTLAGKPAGLQWVDGSAVYAGGVWRVQLQRKLTLSHPEAQSDEHVFRSGDYIPVSFAIWDGSAGDRDGKKNISIWQTLLIQ